MTLDIELYLPGHGDPIQGKEQVHEYIQRNLTLSKEKPQQILTILGQRPMSLTKLLLLFYPKLPTLLYQVKKIELLLLLRYLKKHNLVECETHRKGIRWKVRGVNPTNDTT